MASNVFRFDECWEIPNASIEQVYSVLSRGQLLPLWWKGVYLEAEKLSPGDEPTVGDRTRVLARGFLPYKLNFIVEAEELEPYRRVVVKTIGDFDGRWSAVLTPCGSGVHVDLVWEVTVLRPILRLLAPLLRPAFAWNHRWTTPRGERGLREYLTAPNPLLFAHLG
jgi:Polyketide cyclase / dehydrase and lipid transport